MLANPHVDSTATHWPNSQQLKEHLSFPLALSLQPFANDHPISEIDADSIGNHRCQSCKAFINQLCFIRSDHEYDCSLCGCTNYLSQPIDIRRIQLNSLSYRLRAPEKQRILTSKERLIAFVLDLTLYGQQSKEYLLYAIHLIKTYLKQIHQRGIQMKVLLLGFDTAVHRFTLNSEESTRHISYGIHSEEDQIYFPDVDEMLGHTINSYKIIQNTLIQLEQEVKSSLRGGNGEGLIQALKTALRLSKGYSGNIMLVSGIKEEPHQFKQKMSKFYYDAAQKHSFATNRKECLKGEIDKILQQTQMSLYFYFINAQYINNMPFHVMAKLTNGQLRHYYPNQNMLFFHNLQEYFQTLLDQGTAYESLLKVRYSTGVKMVGLFGNFRPTKVCDQVDLLTCPTHRRYLFQFCIQGRITNDMIIIQFSSLYTDLRGDRFFIIQTHSLRVSSSPRQIIESIDYINVNISYVRGVVHNLDTAGSLRNIQLGLQQRCRKHIAALREASNDDEHNSHQSIDSQLLKKVKPYIIITFLMMKHFLLNQNYQNVIFFDLNAQLRSKISTYDNCINVVWPLVYAVGQDEWEMVEMQEKYIPKGTVGIFIDRCDQYYCYLANPKLQAQLKSANFAKQILANLLQKEQELGPMRRLIDEIKRQKGQHFIDILPIEDLRELKILDMGGQYGFDKFISVLINQ